MNRLPYYALWLLMLCATALVARLSLEQPSAHSLRSQPPLVLTPAQQSALLALPPVTVDAYVQNNPRLRRAIGELIADVSAYTPALTLHFQSLEHDPVSAQARGIQREGQLYLSTSTGKSLRVDTLSPLSVVNALLRLQGQQSSKIIHLQGHGERGFLSDSAGSWQAFYQQYQGSEVLHAALTQGEMPLPQESLLIIADPQSALSPEDEAELRAHIAAGNSIVYSTDSHKPYLPTVLAELAGVQLAEGVMVDANASTYGLENPQWLVIEQLGDSPVTRALKQAPILATAVALLPHGEAQEGFTRQVLLWSGERSWSERHAHEKSLHADPEEAQGSLPLAWQLSRPHPHDAQRMQYLFLLGDSDLGNSVYFSGGNRAFLNQMLALTRQDALPSVQKPERQDQYVQLSPQSALGLGVLLIIALPALPLLIGLVFWWRRRRSMT